MRTFICTLTFFAILSFAFGASAQEVTRMPEGARHAVGVDGGLEGAFTARAAYSYRFGLLGFDPEARVFARFTLPVVAPDFGDWAVDGGAQITPLRWRDLRVAVLAGPVMRKTDNRLFSALALGVSATLLIGYEGPRWGLSAEAGYEQLFASHLSHSDLYKNTFYAGVQDGWYAFSGSVAHAGLRGGARLGALEIFARAGLDSTGQFHSLTPPYYGAIGVGYAF
jgi:hypothetical protein